MKNPWKKLTAEGIELIKVLKNERDKLRDELKTEKANMQEAIEKIETLADAYAETGSQDYASCKSAGMNECLEVIREIQGQAEGKDERD